MQRQQTFHAETRVWFAEPAVLEVSACRETRVKGGAEQRAKVAFSHSRCMATIAFPMYGQRSRIKLRTSLVSLFLHTPFKKDSYMGGEFLKLID